MIICDVIMPQLDGIEAAILIREFLPSCKILLFSGQAATADLLVSARARGYEFEIFAKPVHPQDLLAWLRGDSEPIVWKPIAVPYVVAEKPIPVPIEAAAKEKAVRLPAPKERFTPFFAVKLIGLYAIFLAKIIVVLIVVFGILAFVGFCIDQVSARAPHIQRQHYTEPKPDNDDTRFRLLKA